MGNREKTGKNREIENCEIFEFFVKIRGKNGISQQNFTEVKYFTGVEWKKLFPGGSEELGRSHIKANLTHKNIATGSLVSGISLKSSQAAPI